MKMNPKEKTIAALKKAVDTDKVRTKVENQNNAGWAIGIGIKGKFIVPK